MMSCVSGRMFAPAVLLAFGSSLLLSGCNKPEPAPVPVVPKVSVNAIMVTMVDNAGHVLWDVEKPDGAPKDEADWLEIEDHAIQMAAAGSLIQLGGTGPADAGWIRQVGWSKSADMMADAALTALSAAKARDLPALIKANGLLADSCTSCHDAFKPGLPTEGITHQRPHSESHSK